MPLSVLDVRHQNVSFTSCYLFIILKADVVPSLFSLSFFSLYFLVVHFKNKLCLLRCFAVLLIASCRYYYCIILRLRQGQTMATVDDVCLSRKWKWLWGCLSGKTMERN